MLDLWLNRYAPPGDHSRLVALLMRTIFLTQWFDPEPGAIRGLPLATVADVPRPRRSLSSRAVPNYPAGGLITTGYRMRLWQREVMDGVPVLRVPLYPSHDTSPVGAGGELQRSFALSAATLGAALIGRGDIAYVYHPPATVGLARRGCSRRCAECRSSITSLTCGPSPSCSRACCRVRPLRRNGPRPALGVVPRGLSTGEASDHRASPGSSGSSSNVASPADRCHVIYKLTTTGDDVPPPSRSMGARDASSVRGALQYSLLRRVTSDPLQGLDASSGRRPRVRSMRRFRSSSSAPGTAGERRGVRASRTSVGASKRSSSSVAVPITRCEDQRANRRRASGPPARSSVLPRDDSRPGHSGLCLCARYRPRPRSTADQHGRGRIASATWSCWNRRA